MPKKIDLKGKRFGRLIVVKETEERYFHSVVWECMCDCGNVVKKNSASLKAGGIKSCGCLQSDNYAKMSVDMKLDLTGQKFGRLTAIKETGEKYFGNIVWECKCECGNLTTISSLHLKSGNTQSCGCLKKEMLTTYNEENEYLENTQLNSLTKKKASNNTSGIKGVHWSTREQKWQAEIRFQGEKHNLGQYEKIEDATKARKEAEEKYFTPILEKYGRLENE